VFSQVYWAKTDIRENKQVLRINMLSDLSVMFRGRLSEQLKSAHSQLDTVNDEKEHLQERHHIIVEQTRRDLAVKHAECQEYKAKVDRSSVPLNKTPNVNVASISVLSS